MGYAQKQCGICGAVPLSSDMCSVYMHWSEQRPGKTIVVVSLLFKMVGGLCKRVGEYQDGWLFVRLFAYLFGWLITKVSFMLEEYWHLDARSQLLH